MYLAYDNGVLYFIDKFVFIFKYKCLTSSREMELLFITLDKL